MIANDSIHSAMPEQNSPVTSPLAATSLSSPDGSIHFPHAKVAASNDAGNDDTKGFFQSFIDLRPEGLYTDNDEEDNIVMKVADTTCASVGFFLYPILVALRLLAQLALIPLILFQVLGAYAWICVTDHFYCASNLNRYRLGLDQAAIAFSFYCSLLIAILSSAVLRWFPCSKNARKANANCIM